MRMRLMLIENNKKKNQIPTKRLVASSFFPHCSKPEHVDRNIKKKKKPSKKKQELKSTLNAKKTPFDFSMKLIQSGQIDQANDFFIEMKRYEMKTVNLNYNSELFLL